MHNDSAWFLDLEELVEWIMSLGRARGDARRAKVVV